MSAYTDFCDKLWAGGLKVEHDPFGCAIKISKPAEKGILIDTICFEIWYYMDLIGTGWTGKITEGQIEEIYQDLLSRRILGVVDE